MFIFNTKKYKVPKLVKGFGRLEKTFNYFRKSRLTYFKCIKVTTLQLKFDMYSMLKVYKTSKPIKASKKMMFILARSLPPI